ncbi:MAG: helix-turn-helix domain-containing protein [Hassallia sp.]
MEEKPLAVRLGILIRQLRLKTGMSQEEFADLCGLHRTYIGFIERGEKTITIETANKIAQALGLTLAQLFKELDRVDPS